MIIFLDSTKLKIVWTKITTLFLSKQYSDNYSKTLWQFCQEILVVNNDGIVVDFNGANATGSFNSKTKIRGNTAADNNNGNIAGRVNV